MESIFRRYEVTQKPEGYTVVADVLLRISHVNSQLICVTTTQNNDESLSHNFISFTDATINDFKIQVIFSLKI